MGSLKEIADKINLLLDSVTVRRETDAIDPMVALESAVSYGGLVWQTTSIAQCENEANAENLKSLTDLLARRWQYIKKTDASYFYNQNSVANQLYLGVAKILAEYLNVDFYSLLMPGLEGLDPNKKLHEYICRPKKSDPEQLELLLVTEGFEQLEKKYGEKNEENENTSPESELDDDDEQLLSNHSEAASDYYAALRWKIGDRAELKTKFLEALQSDEYKVTQKLGSHSNEELIPGILARITTKHQFISLLKNLPIPRWKEFLSKVKNPVLFRLMLGLNDYETQEAKLKPEDLTQLLRAKWDISLKAKPGNLECFADKYLRADFVIQHEIYERIRVRPSYQTIGATLSSYLPTTGFSGFFVRAVKTPAVDKQTKLSKCNDNREYLLDEKNPVEGIKSDDVASEGGSYNLLVGKNGYIQQRIQRAREMAYDAMRESSRTSMRL